MFFNKKNRTRADYVGSDPYSQEYGEVSSLYGGDDDAYDDTAQETNSYGDNDDRTKFGDVNAIEAHRRKKSLDFKWHELTVIAIEVLLVLYLFLVLGGVVSLV